MADAIKLGAQLWFVPDRHYGQPRFKTVKKIGRKWAYTTDRQRFDMKTMQADPDTSCRGMYYRDREDYEAKQKLQLAWNKFRTYVSGKWSVPKDVSLSDVEHAAVLLGFSVGGTVDG